MTATAIARKEFTDMWRDGRLRIALVVVGALLLASLLAGLAHHRAAKAERDAARTLAYEQWLNQGARNPHSATHYGIFAFKPMSSLAFVDRGVESYTGTATLLESHVQHEFYLRPAKDRANIGRVGELTGAFVLQLFVPLLVILLTFASVSGEKESGTLRQSLSLGVSRAQLGLGKALGIAGVLAVPLLPALAVGVLALGLTRTEAGAAGDVGRGGAMLLAYAVYLAVLLLVSLGVSARASSSGRSLLMLIGFWVVTGLMVPRGAADLSKRLHPTPSSIQFTQKMNHEVLAAEQGRQDALKQAVFAQYGVSRIEDLPFNFEGLDLQDSEEKGNVVIDRYYSDLNAVYLKQHRLQGLAAALSPTQAVRLLSMGLAGTDLHQQQDFARAGEAYRRRMVEAMNQAVRDNVGVVDPGYFGDQTLNRKADRALWETIPPFSYSPPGIGWVLTNHSFSGIILALWLAAAALFTWRSMARVRVD